MRSTPYSIKTLIQFLSTVGFKNVEFRIFSLKSNRDYHPFVIRLCHQVVTHRGYYSVWSPGFLLACWSRLMLRFAPAALAVYALLLEWSDG